MPYTWSNMTWKRQFPSLSTTRTLKRGVVLGPEKLGEVGYLIVVGAVPGVPVMFPGGAVRGGQRGLSAIPHHRIPNGKDGIQPVPPTLRAVAAIV